MNESLEIISENIKKLVFIGSIAVTLCAVPPAEAQQTTKPLNWCGTPARSTRRSARVRVWEEPAEAAPAAGADRAADSSHR